MANEEELFKKIKMLESLAKMPLSNPHPVVSMDLSGILLFRNQAYIKFVESLGSESTLLREKLFDYCGLAFREHRNITTELNLGHRTFILSAVPDFADSSTVFYLIETTTQKQLEDDLREASRLSTLGEMTGSIAHEINNPLSLIKSYSYFIIKMVAQGKIAPEEFTERAQKISDLVDRIAVIIKTLKGFSRKQAVENKSMISMQTVFKMTEEMVQLKIKGTSIALSFEVDPALKVFASEVPLSQVFINLINNAIDANDKQVEGWIRVRAIRSDGEIIADVQDSGSGIPESIRNQLFKKTVTTKESGKGTGLGLRITRQIVESFGGTISIDETASNTRFVMRFPDLELLSSRV